MRFRSAENEKDSSEATLCFFLIFFLISGCDSQSDTPSPLEIDRQYRKLDYPYFFRLESLENLQPDDEGLVTAKVNLAPSLLFSFKRMFRPGGDVAVAADPFAPEPAYDSFPDEIPTTRAYFEHVGIEFGDKGSVKYDYERLQLIFKLEPDKVDRVYRYFESIKIDQMKQIFVRLDQFDLSIDDAQLLLESGKAAGTHLHEFESAKKLISEGRGSRLSYSAVTRSGSKTTLRCPFEFIFDAVLGADNQTIDFQLETSAKVSQFSAIDKLPLLVGAGPPSSDERVSVYFVTPSIQLVSRYFTRTKQPATGSTIVDTGGTKMGVRRNDLSNFRVIDENGDFRFENQQFQTVYYRAPRWIFDSPLDGGLNFEEEKEAKLPPENRVRFFFENKGIDFSEGSSINYDQESQLLRVTHLPSELASIDEFFHEQRCRADKQVQIRLEAWRLHSSHGRQLLKSVQVESDHNPEYAAVVKASQLGDATLVDVQTVTGKSGQRAMIEENSESADKPDAISPAFLVVDPLIDGDNYTIDLNFSYKCKFGPGDEQRFQFTGLLTIFDGNHTLIGTAPTPEGDTLAVFASVNIQYPGGWYTRLIRSE